MASQPGSSSTKRSWSLVDVGAAAAVVLAAAGVIWSPKLSGAVAKATGGVVPVTVMVDVRGIPAADPAALIAGAREEGKVAIVIRNQPHGTVPINPNQKSFGTFDARFILEGEGRRSAGGVVFGNQTIKIGAPVELEGGRYRFGGSVTDLQSGAQ